ncbi:roadblock/LC7 domain-containing protein [Nocardia takedensis]|uniref:roadblock/LC7 domain-containing protein n=1 Tax=Nocardia takedensis TaxID=259390 RepID=UPI0002EC285D|nr:roadblock/LC7 domain-containing protein [Nocardia takedensis]
MNTANRHEVLLGDPRAVARVLQRACREIEDVEHAVLTSRDGLVVAANDEAGGSSGEDTVAMRGSAMAAAAAGIGDHFVGLVTRGRLQAAVFEADRGCVGVFPVSSTLLLVVTSMPQVNLGRFNAAAKRVLSMLQEPQV